MESLLEIFSVLTIRQFQRLQLLLRQGNMSEKPDLSAIIKIGWLVNSFGKVSLNHYNWGGRKESNIPLYIPARKPQAFKPGDEWHPERSRRSWRSGGESGIIWLWPDMERAPTRSTVFNTIWYGYPNIGSGFLKAK